MQTQPNEAAPLPGYKKPITLVQMGVILALAVIACVGGVALLIFTGGEAGAETAVSPNQSAIVPAVNTEAIAQGEAIFAANCAACHSVGGGVRVGPDLAGVVARRDADWLSRWIAEPDAMLAEGDPIATELLAEFNSITMPNLQQGVALQVAADPCWGQTAKRDTRCPRRPFPPPLMLFPLSAIPPTCPRRLRPARRSTTW